MQDLSLTVKKEKTAPKELETIEEKIAKLKRSGKIKEIATKKTDKSKDTER